MVMKEHVNPCNSVEHRYVFISFELWHKEIKCFIIFQALDTQTIFVVWSINQFISFWFSLDLLKISKKNRQTYNCYWPFNMSCCCAQTPKPWVSLTLPFTSPLTRSPCCAKLLSANNVSHLPLQGTNDGCDVDLRMCASVNIWLCFGESPGRKCQPVRKNSWSADSHCNLKESSVTVILLPRQHQWGEDPRSI